MNFDLSDEQRMLFDESLKYLSEHCPPAELRRLIDGGEEWSAKLWSGVAEMGFLGVATPEQYGGLGLGWLDMGLISEALGRVNAPLPVFSSTVLAAEAIAMAGSEAQRGKWLPRLASGEMVATFAYAEGRDPSPWLSSSSVCAGGRLNGIKSPVADGGVASLAVVSTGGAQGPALALVELNQAGVDRTRLESFDQLRAHYQLTFFDVEAELLGTGGSLALVQRLFDRAAVQAAFEAIGGADACLQMARAYALDRRIFGRSLASYQAIKHKLADVLVAVELARSSAYFAAWAADHDPQALAAAAAAARLLAIEAFERAARENMQVHGGVAYTFETDCHFYFRRERTLATNLGGREPWAERLAACLAAPPSEATGD